MPLNINLEAVSFAYPGQKDIFHKINLVLPEDKIVVLSGENGTGKSTLAKLIAGILKPQKGEIRCTDKNNEPVKKKDIWQYLAYLQQNAQNNVACANPDEDLALWLVTRQLPVAVRNSVIQKTLFNWKLCDKRENPVWEFSAGELKSLALAGISLCPERYWILDEPLAGLDKEHQDTLLALLQARRQKGMGGLIISHQTELFTKIADRRLHINHQDGIEWID